MSSIMTKLTDHKPLVTRDVFGNWQKSGRRILEVQPPNGGSYRHWSQWYHWTQSHIQYETVNGKQELINMRTITIELRFDADEEERHEVLRDAAKQAAKHLYTSALLISAKRKPKIAMYTSDMFAGSEEIMLADDLPL